jgi:predicted DNA-binding transcriptional regulator YafY
LQIKQGDLQRKTQKDMQDMQAKMAQIQVELKRIEVTQETEGAKIMMKNMHDSEKTKASQETEGARAGLEMMKHQQQLAQQKEMAESNRQQQAQKPKPKKGD